MSDTPKSVNLTTARDATRRAFMTSAASGLGAAALGSLLTRDGMLADDTNGDDQFGGTIGTHFPATAKNCIFIYLAGGTSHVELFDPKPRLTELTGEPLPDSFLRGEKRLSFLDMKKSKLMGSRCEFKRYGKCGMELSEHLPQIGAHADKLALIRSMHTNEFDHGPAEIFFSTGSSSPGRPSAGAWVTYGLGSENRNLPSYVVLITGRSPVARSINWGSGFLPTETGGVLFRSQGEPILNLASPAGVLSSAQRAELDAIQALNRERLNAVDDSKIADRIRAYELAFRMQVAAPELIDLKTETQKTLDAYGTERDGVEHASFANNCLLARRMVERGVRFVTIGQRRWDHHGAVAKGIRHCSNIVDQPIGALLTDLEERGLLDTTLVVWGTEFGRTPVTQNSDPDKNAGRDHHRFGYSMWMAGGGVKGGKVVGATDELGWRAEKDPVHVHDFHATLLHLFGMDHLRLTYRYQGLDFRLTDQHGKVVKQVFS